MPQLLKKLGNLSTCCKPPRGDLFSGLVKSHPASQWQLVSSVSGQAHVNVTYELTSVLEIPQLFEKLPYAPNFPVSSAALQTDTAPEGNLGKRNRLPEVPIGDSIRGSQEG
jgi:hypothetical protein